MSYMDTNLALDPSTGIQELSLNEIEQVEGGALLLAVAIGVGIAACLIVGWEAAHNRAEAAE
jgi:lactobin A/cerein 7B family class IIb bacteriocin